MIRDESLLLCMHLCMHLLCMHMLCYQFLQSNVNLLFIIYFTYRTCINIKTMAFTHFFKNLLRLFLNEKRKLIEKHKFFNTLLILQDILNQRIFSMIQTITKPYSKFIWYRLYFYFHLNLWKSDKVILITKMWEHNLYIYYYFLNINHSYISK